MHNKNYFKKYLRRQTGKLLLHLPTCKHFLMLEPDILNPGLHLNVTDSPNDCPSTVLTLLLTFPGFPHDAGLREEVEPRESEKPGQSQNKVDLSGFTVRIGNNVDLIKPFVHHKVRHNIFLCFKD